MVAEGSRSIDEDMAMSKATEENHDAIRFGGIGNKLAGEIERLTGIESRVTVLGYLQRGGRPIPYDRIISTRYGVEAVELVHREEYGKMVSLKGNRITSVSLEEVAGAIKTVPPEGELVRIAKSVGVSFGD